MIKNNMKHFHLDFPFPKYATLAPYKKKPQSNSKAKNKHKLTKFTYYRTPQGIIKLLFLDDQHYIDQGFYPFTNPSGQVKSFEELKGQVERIIYLQSVYICHFEENGVTKLVLKKVTQAKINAQTSQIDTIDDNFQILPQANIQRWNQFLKVEKGNPNAGGSSIRVIVDQKFGEENQAEILDYQFFQRQQTLKHNKFSQMKQVPTISAGKQQEKNEVSKIAEEISQQPGPKTQTTMKEKKKEKK